VTCRGERERASAVDPPRHILAVIRVDSLNKMSLTISQDDSPACTLRMRD